MNIAPHERRGVRRHRRCRVQEPGSYEHRATRAPRRAQAQKMQSAGEGKHVARARAHKVTASRAAASRSADVGRDVLPLLSTERFVGYGVSEPSLRASDCALPT
jgi:hypothetical protein